MKDQFIPRRAERGPRARARRVGGRLYDGRNAMALLEAMRGLGAALEAIGVGEVTIELAPELAARIDAELAAHPIARRLVQASISPPFVAHGGVKFAWRRDR